MQTTNKNEPTESIESSQYSESKSLFTNNFSDKDINSFNDMNLKIDILRGIYSLGFVNPTGLQKRVIVHCLNGRDIIVLSGPGNGRTMMFTIPLLQRISTTLNECQVLIIVPTRDLAVHIQKVYFFTLFWSLLFLLYNLIFFLLNVDHIERWGFYGC